MVMLQGVALSDVLLPVALETIEADAFRGDSSLTHVALPDDVQSIGKRKSM